MGKIGRKAGVTIKVKLFTGLAEDAGLKGYDPEKGVTVQVPRGTRLRKVTKILGLPDRRRLAYFVDGERAGLWKKLEKSHEIACLRPSGGG